MAKHLGKLFILVFILINQIADTQSCCIALPISGALV